MQLALLDVADDADDRERVGYLLRPPWGNGHGAERLRREALAERILTRPEAARHRLVDERNGRAGRPVTVRELTTAQEQCAQRREVPWTHDTKTDDRILRGRVERPTKHVQPCAEPPAEEGPRVHDGNLLNLGKLVQAAEHLLIELGDATRRAVFRRREPQLDRQQMGGPKARIDLLEVPQTPHKEPGAAHQHQRQPELPQPQSPPPPPI